MRRLRFLLAASLIAVAVSEEPRQASAQWIVFDPNNYAQNLLTVAREIAAD
ncbi:DUF4141 domain-containing protein [Bradyrhizobium sp. I1.7.5]|uniref:DUF4141 domain-containing protein n=1 Tax=Bradyrhizobium sp. I1.7.5 TaxID=3156363 RepID=UPI0033908F5D